MAPSPQLQQPLHPTDPNVAGKPYIYGMEDYRRLIGDENADRILTKSEPLAGTHIVNVNSTYYGGGVAELLSSMTLLMNTLGLPTGWRVLQGSPDFFGVTKKMHNALQGGDFNFSTMKREIYEGVVYENAIRNHLTHDVVIVHDPQPLPIIEHFKKTVPWIWRCHIDLSNPHRELWTYLRRFVEQYDAVIVSQEDYKHALNTPQLVFEPAIDPFSIKNKIMSPEEVDERLDHYDIPTDLPLVVQVSRFDRWKDPKGVIEAFKKAQKEVDARLVLLGNVATDDPEGKQVYESLLEEESDTIMLLSVEDTALVNALQCKAAVVLQKSLREGFGLTVAEAMWKENAVIGGNVGGIRAQIEDGVNGFLVNDVDEAAARIVELVQDEDKRKVMGRRAKETVRERYLLSRYVENYLDLLHALQVKVVLREGAHIG